MKDRNPIARAVHFVRMKVKERRFPDSMDCTECAGMGIIYDFANDEEHNPYKVYPVCKACNGTGVAK